MTTTPAVVATRDQVLASRVSNPFYATTDAAGMFEVLGPAGPDQVYVQGRRTGALAVVTRTGRVLRYGDQVRVRFDFAVDTGDVAGTLSFTGERTGGLVPFDAFDLEGSA